MRRLLVLLAVIASMLGVYRFGYRRGLQDGPVIPSTMSAHQIYGREYDVADLVASTADAAKLIAAIRASAAYSSWDVFGGYATISVADNQTSLVIEQTFAGHVAVVEYLSRVREFIKENGPAEIAFVIRELENEKVVASH